MCRRHVDKDLEPYVCVFPECKGSLEFFNNYDDWLEHSKKSHSFEWYCDAAAHVAEVFKTKQDFQDHMKTIHAGTFTESQLPVITEMGARQGSRPFTICPLCNCLPEDIEAEQKKIGSDALELLPKHIAGHLKSLAFISLPWREDIDDEEGDDVSKQIADFSHDASEGKKTREEEDAQSIIDIDMASMSLSFDEDPSEQADTVSLKFTIVSIYNSTNAPLYSHRLLTQISSGNSSMSIYMRTRQTLLCRKPLIVRQTIPKWRASLPSSPGPWEMTREKGRKVQLLGLEITLWDGSVPFRKSWQQLKRC